MSDTTDETKTTEETKAPEADVPPAPEPEPEAAAAAPADGVIRDAAGNAVRHLRKEEIARMNEAARKA